MPSRRQFLSVLAPSVILPACANLAVSSKTVAHLENVPGTADELAEDEDFWFEVQRAFTVDRSVINFNNGGVSPSPAWVQDAQKRRLDHANLCPAYNLWRIQEPQKETVRQALAKEWKCDTEELAFTRNASEGLEICQFGFDLEPGDEVLCTNQDYPRMINTWKQREKRDGIKLVQFSIPTPCDDPKQIVEAYRKHITPKTKVILVCHVINLTGQILPVTEVTKLGREHGIPVIVDGAHAFANVHFDFEALDVDYYATSLHKWLNAPHGTGMLYVRRSKIEGLWSLMAQNPDQDDNIRKFEQIGTHPIAQILAVGEALIFHQGVGGARKQARMVYLRDRFAKRLLEHPKVRLNTSLAPGMGAFANVGIDGIDTSKLGSHLWSKHRIVTTTIKHDEFDGLRVTPGIYATLQEVDKFTDAMLEVADKGLPS